MRDVWKHFDITADNIILSECGSQQFLPGQRYSYVVTENFVLHYIESGGGLIQIDNKTYHSDDFNGYILRRGQTVSYSGDRLDPWKTYWVGIKGSHFQDFLLKLQLHSLDILHFPPNSKAVSIIKEICMETKKNQEISSLWYKLKTYELLLALDSEFRNVDYIDFDYNKDIIVQIYDYICKNYDRNLTVKKICEIFMISRSNLFQKFKEKYDTTPKTFMLVLQIDKACQLLRETTLPIANIGFQVGFDDYAVFSKAFKNIIGFSPSAYRKRNDKKEIHEKN